MSNDELAVQMEALLFALGRPAGRTELAKMLGVAHEEIDAAAGVLRQSAGRGVALVDDGDLLELRAAAQAAALIERVRREEYTREVGRAGQETLSAVLYRGPLTRAEIDFIRGVNSTQTLRTLVMRGLLRRTPNPRDERQYLYQPTTELLAELGITSVTELPDYAQVREKLTSLETAYRAHEAEQTHEV